MVALRPFTFAVEQFDHLVISTDDGQGGLELVAGVGNKFLLPPFGLDDWLNRPLGKEGQQEGVQGQGGQPEDNCRLEDLVDAGHQDGFIQEDNRGELALLAPAVRVGGPIIKSVAVSAPVAVLGRKRFDFLQFNGGNMVVIDFDDLAGRIKADAEVTVLKDPFPVHFPLTLEGGGRRGDVTLVVDQGGQHGFDFLVGFIISRADQTTDDRG